MYHLATTTNLSFLLGLEVIQISVGVNEVLLNFVGGVTLAIFQRCQLGSNVYSAGPEAGAVLIDLLGRAVRRADSLDGRHLRLTLDDGTVLVALEVDEPYESYALTSPTGTIVV